MRTQQSADAGARQVHWLHPDAHRWVRPDCAKFLKPGTDPADVYPALARQRDRARQHRARDDADASARKDMVREDMAVAAALAQERAGLDWLQGEWLGIKSDLAFNRFVVARCAEIQPLPATRAAGPWPPERAMD